MAIILNPDKSGCTIFSGKNKQYIKGSSLEVAKKIENYVTKGGYNKMQYEDVFLDCNEFGIEYEKYFKENNIRFIRISEKNIIAPWDKMEE